MRYCDPDETNFSLVLILNFFRKQLHNTFSNLGEYGIERLRWYGQGEEGSGNSGKVFGAPEYLENSV